MHVYICHDTAVNGQCKHGLVTSTVIFYKSWRSAIVADNRAKNFNIA